MSQKKKPSVLCTCGRTFRSPASLWRHHIVAADPIAVQAAGYRKTRRRKLAAAMRVAIAVDDFPDDIHWTPTRIAAMLDRVLAGEPR